MYKLFQEANIDAKIIPHNKYILNDYTKKIPIIEYPYLHFVINRCISRDIPQEDPLIFHVLYQSASYYKAFNVIKRKKNIIKILTIHDIFNKYGSIDENITKKIEKADVIFVPSKFTQNEVKAMGYQGLIWVTYNPVDVRTFFEYPPEKKQRYRKSFLEKYNLSKDTRLILYVGAEKPCKNIEGVFEVMKLLLYKEKIPVELIKIGKPTQRGYLERLAKRYEISKNIIWIDYVSEEELARFYNISDLLITLSRCEGFGMPIVEAMASGLPVIAANKTAIPEVVKNGGVLVDPTDYEKIIEKILSLLNSQKIRAKLKHKEKQQVKSYLPEKIFKLYIEGYTRSMEDII